MPDKMRYPIYDSVNFLSTAIAEAALFQVPQGGDTAHTKSFTNARGAGAFPSGESFEVDNVSVFADFNPTIPDDLYLVWVNSYLEIRVADKSRLFIPLRLAANYNNFEGMFTQATAANKTLGGIKNDGLDLDIPIKIAGGTAFRVNILQGSNLTIATAPMRVVLNGILTQD